MASTSGWVTAYDATTWQAEDSLPEAGLYFLYNDANYAAPPEAYTRFEQEGHPVATICVNNTTVANEYDYEAGNQNNPVPWAQMMRSDYGYTGVIYCDFAHVQEVLDKFSNAQVAPPYFRLANWTGSAPGEVPDYGAGTVGIQYTDQGDGGQVDISLVSPEYPVIGPKGGHNPPAPAPEGTSYQYRAGHNTRTPINADGSFGPLSVKALQFVLFSDQGLIDGRLGHGTISQLQTMLFEDPTKVDGLLGPETTRAVQQKAGTATDGIWGYQTSLAVQRALNAGTFYGLA